MPVLENFDRGPLACAQTHRCLPLPTQRDRLSEVIPVGVGDKEALDIGEGAAERAKGIFEPSPFSMA